MRETQTLGERCVEVAMAELKAKVKEEPLGSNTGKRIREYLYPCVRGDRNTRLGLTASNWCMAFASWCLFKAKRDDEVPPHGYRAGVVEAVADTRDPKARWSGQWVPIEQVRTGKWVPREGDLAVYDRSQRGRPSTSWWRHVNRVVKYELDTGMFLAVGGNEQQKVTLAQHTIASDRMLGFIAYPASNVQAITREELTPEEKVQISHLVYLTIDGIIRESVWELIEDDD